MGERKSLYSRFMFRLREVGLRYTLYLIMRKLCFPYLVQSERLFIIALPLSTNDPNKPNDPLSREMMRDEATRITDLGYPIEEVEAKFRRGERCWVMERANELLACDWVQPSVQDKIGWIVLGKDPNDIWSAGIIVKPNERGKGIAPLLRSHVMRECARGGVRRMLGIIDTPNHNSIRAMKRVGYKPVGTLFYFRVFGFAIVRSGKHWHWGVWRKTSPLRLSPSELADKSCRWQWNAITSN